MKTLIEKLEELKFLTVYPDSTARWEVKTFVNRDEVIALIREHQAEQQEKLREAADALRKDIADYGHAGSVGHALSIIDTLIQQDKPESAG